MNLLCVCVYGCMYVFARIMSVCISLRTYLRIFIYRYGWICVYTMRSISFRTDFFKYQKKSDLSANPLTKYYQPTSVHTLSFVCLSSTVYEL
jgi:hypothetical protein